MEDIIYYIGFLYALFLIRGIYSGLFDGNEKLEKVADGMRIEEISLDNAMKSLDYGAKELNSKNDLIGKILSPIFFIYTVFAYASTDSYLFLSIIVISLINLICAMVIATINIFRKQRIYNFNTFTFIYTSSHVLKLILVSVILYSHFIK